MIFFIILSFVFSLDVTYDVLTASISNCVAYNADPYNPYKEVCELCADDYRLSEDRDSCIYDVVTNCQYQ